MAGRPQELRKLSRLALVLGLSAMAAANGSCGDAGQAPVCDDPSTELFEQRVAPLLAEDQPKSCNQCHLSGIDLSAIVRDNPCEAMACLVKDELVDLKQPESSLILSWIERAEPDSELITQEVIDLEYQAFLEWIEREADCRSCAKTRCREPEDKPFCEPDISPSEAADTSEYEGDCSDKALESLFLETVYAMRGRCYPCHFTSNTSIEDAPKWISQEGDCLQASLATMRNVIDSGYANPDEPLESLLLLKPLSESYGGVEHGGHDKIAPSNDAGYENFVAWLTHYAECVSDD